MEASAPLPEAAEWARLIDDLEAGLEAKDRALEAKSGDLAAKDREIEVLKAELERLRGGG